MGGRWAASQPMAIYKKISYRQSDLSPPPAGITKGRLQKFMLGKLVDFSIKWMGGVSIVH